MGMKKKSEVIKLYQDSLKNYAESTLVSVFYGIDSKKYLSLDELAKKHDLLVYAYGTVLGYSLDEIGNDQKEALTQYREILNHMEIETPGNHLCEFFTLKCYSGKSFYVCPDKYKSGYCNIKGEKEPEPETCPYLEPDCVGDQCDELKGIYHCPVAADSIPVRY